MSGSLQNPNENQGKGISKGKSNSGELLKTPSQSGNTLGNSGDKPESKVDFLLPPNAPGDMGSLGGFRIIKILGEGGMGLVFLAEDSSLNRKLAIKVILPTHANQTTKERFFREARATAALHHDNVIAIFQVGEDNGVPFLAMPFLQGQPLDKYLAEQKKLSVKEALRITMEGLAGLSSAHSRNMVHRDIKPSNIWLEGARKKVILLDFGLAKGGGGEDTKLTRVGAIMGTPAYMSPEQAQAKEVDRRSDLFSIGVVLYEMLTGEGPFRGKTVMAVLANLMSKDPSPPSEVDPSISQEVSDICMWMLEKDVEKRPNSARDVAARIQAFEKGKGKPQELAELPQATNPAKTLQGNPVKTQEGQWKPKNIEEFSRLYPEIDSTRPRPSGVMPRKTKKKKSSLVPLVMGLGGVLFFVLGLVFLLFNRNPKSNQGANKNGLLTQQVNKGATGSNEGSGFEDLFPDAGHLDKWVNRIANNYDKEKIPNNWNWDMKGIQSSSELDCLVSKKEYGDFILKLEIKLATNADSGIILRQPYPEQKNDRHRPIELQLQGPMRDEKHAAILQSGAMSHFIPPINKVNLDREWNEVWIKFEGTHLYAKINGQIVQDLDFASTIIEVGDQAERIKKMAKRPLKGHLGFQCFVTGGEPIIFRNVQIKELNQTKPGATQEPYEIVAGNGYEVVDHLVKTTGAKGYWQWDGAREVSQSKKGESLPPNEFGEIAEKAFKQAPKIHFDLATFSDPINAAETGKQKGWVRGNLTNAQLHMVVSRPDLLRKTNFYKNGVPIPNPFPVDQPTTYQEPYEVATGVGPTVTDKIIEITMAKPIRILPGEEKWPFSKVAERAFNQAQKIHFDLKTLNDPVEAAKVGGEKGWVTGNYLRAQLYLVVSRPELLRKTVFYKDGVQVPSPFKDKPNDDKEKKQKR